MKTYEGDMEMAIVGITWRGQVYVGDCSYFKKVSAKLSCIKFEMFLVDDLDLFLERVDSGEITKEQIEQWIDESPNTIHMNLEHWSVCIRHSLKMNARPKGLF